MPLWLSSNNFQVFSASVANAVVMAMPVTTTFGSAFPVLSSVIAKVLPALNTATPRRYPTIPSLLAGLGQRKAGPSSASGPGAARKAPRVR